MNFLINGLEMIIISVIESLTIWLPISSDGHWILIGSLMDFTLSEELLTIILLFSRFGSLIALILFLWHNLPYISADRHRSSLKSMGFSWLKLLISSLPGVIIPIAFQSPLNEFVSHPVLITLIIFSTALILFYAENRRLGKHAKQIHDINDMSFATAFKIGAFQSFAVIPGVSRAISIIIPGLFQGANRSVITIFYLMISLPTLILLNLPTLINPPTSLISDQWLMLLLVLAVSFFMSTLTIHFLINYIKQHNYKFFAGYNIILAAGILIYYFVL